MLRLYAELAKYPAALSAQRASYLVRRYLPDLKHFNHQPSVHLYASEWAWKTWDIARTVATASEIVQRVTTLMADIVSPPTHIYLLDPEHGMGKRLIQGFRWGGILVNSSAIVYSTTPQHLYFTIGQEMVRTALPPTFNRYPLLSRGLSEYVARGDTETFRYDVCAFLDNQPIYSLREVLDGRAPAPSAGSLAEFLSTQFGWELWKRVHEDIQALHRKWSPLFSALPSVDWLLKRNTGLSVEEIGKRWIHFANLRCRNLNSAQRQAHSGKFAIRRLYEDRDLQECADASLRYLSTYGSDVEVVFYAVASLVHSNDYSSAIQVLSAHADALPQWHRAWAYLRLGQLYDIAGNKELALRSYAIARDLSDAWRVIGSRAERYMVRSFSASRKSLRGDDWVHFRQWWLPHVSRSESQGVLTLYYSIQS